MKDRTLLIAGQHFIGEHRLKSYSTGLDYSYVNVMYFKCIRDIITTIQNDTSDDKWLVFVSNIEKEGKILATALVEDAVLITRGTGQNNLNNPELSSIVNHSKFTKKVLITTKYLDNGINIKDERVKNVVIIAWNQIDFIQMLGRRRVNIENADTVNLYIHMRDSRSFRTLLNIYNDKIENLRLCRENPNEFGRKYDNDLKSIAELNELFYRDRDAGKWTVNPIGEWRVREDKRFVEDMIQQFHDEDRFAFVRKQLSWIGLEETFDQNRLLIRIKTNEEKAELA